jgi:hypothetical protein
LGIFDRMREAVLREIDFSAIDPGDVRGFLRTYVTHPLMAL